MRTRAARFVAMLLLGMLAGPFGLTPGQAFTLTPPPEQLAGLTPGVHTMANALQVHGSFDAAIPGDAGVYAGGERATRAYLWTPGSTLDHTGLVVETSLGASRISLVMVDTFPGLCTSRGLSVLQPDDSARQLYGMPDFVFEWQSVDPPVRELFYVNTGLLVVINQVPGRPNWTITKLILTYPLYLRNAVTERVRESMATHHVEDVTYSYRVWARMAIPPE